jgi:hypothetical protein
MAKRLTNREASNSRVASAASTILRDPQTSKAAKTAAGLALTQRPNRSLFKSGTRAEDAKPAGSLAQPKRPHS